MKSKSNGAGLPVNPKQSLAANEEFPRKEALESLAQTQAGWDPYDVWRTRVKNSVGEREPRR